MKNTTEYIGPQEAAQLAGIPLPTLYQKLREGQVEGATKEPLRKSRWRICKAKFLAQLGAAVAALILTVAPSDAATTLDPNHTFVTSSFSIDPGDYAVILFEPVRSGLHFVTIEFDDFATRPDTRMMFETPAEAIGQSVEWIVRNPADSGFPITGATIASDPFQPELLDNPLCVIEGRNTDWTAETYINFDTGTQWVGRDFDLCAIPEPTSAMLVCLGLVALTLIIARRRA